MEKGKVLFRVDGDAQIGLGHLVRCIALAQMLKEKFEISFFSKNIPPSIVVELEKSELTLIEIDSDLDFFNKIKEQDIVVLDGYQFDIDYQKKIKQLNTKLVCIDDLHDSEFVADLIINHAPGVKPSDYKACSYTRYALGLDYVLLRSAFLTQARKPSVARYKNTAFICFGGADPGNLTKQILETVLETNAFKKIIVVVGAAYNFDDSIKDIIKHNSSVVYYKAINQDEMLDLMLQTDLAVIPSSGILFEAMATGCHIVSGYYIDNQKILYKRLSDATAFIPAGSFKKNDVQNAIKEFLSSNSETVRLINGASDKNILYRFNYLSSVLRNAGLADSKLIFDWANDPSVRLFAFNQESIPWDSHQNWFNNKLKDENCYIYILSLRGIDVGQIRFDILDKMATISYLIGEKYRGQHLGMLIVERGINLIRENKKADVLKALVKPENEASIKIFKRLGFSQNTENYQYHNEICAFTLTL